MLLPSLALAAANDVEIGSPVLIVQGPPGEQRWGRYQFPSIYRMDGNRLMVSVHVEADAAEAYGLPSRLFVSSDGGASWREDSGAMKRPHGLRLPNGDWLRIDTPAALRAEKLKFPQPVGQMNSYSLTYTLYRVADLPPALRRIFFRRFTRRSWHSQSAELEDPLALRYVVDGRFPMIWWGDLRTTPDGQILAVTYPSITQSGSRFVANAACFRSQDFGRTWNLQGRIAYQPDPKADPKADLRDGFTEPAFEILADGSLLAVLRTTDGHGIGPMYHSYSQDSGKTWTRPVAFAPNGVLPRLLRLGNGVLVLASGRPGAELRFSFDGRGESWTPPYPLVTLSSDKSQVDSCGYTDLVALDANTFLVVYSWFRMPDTEGRPRKSILVRRVRVPMPEPLPPKRDVNPAGG